MAEADHVLVLRLAGPMQSWGSRSQFNRRDTDDQPTKSGIVGLLAAAAGRRRGDPIEDLVGLRLAVRVDQPGTLLRDYHTVSNYTGQSHLTASVNKSGRQERRPDNPEEQDVGDHQVLPPGRRVRRRGRRPHGLAANPRRGAPTAKLPPCVGSALVRAHPAAPAGRRRQRPVARTARRCHRIGALAGRPSGPGSRE